MNSKKISNENYDIFCDNLQKKIVDCYSQFDKIYIFKKKKLKECEKYIQELQFCFISLNKNKIRSKERTSAIYENRTELVQKYFKEKRDNKISTLDYLESRNPEMAPNKTPTKYTIEL